MRFSLVCFLILIAALQVAGFVQVGFSQPFSLSTDQTTGTVNPGQNITITVHATLLSGTGDQINLFAQGLPQDATVIFQPQTGTPTFSSTMTIATQATTPTGNFVITIIGASPRISNATAFILTVDRPPVLAAIGAKQVQEGTTLSFTASASDNDLPTQSLTFSLALAPSGNYPQGASITSAGVFTWTPTEAQGPGTYVARIMVSDGVTTDFEDVTITVSEQQSTSELLTSNWPILTLVASFAALAIGYALGKPKPAAWYSSAPPPCGVTCNCTGAMCGHGAAGHCPPPGCVGHGHCARALCVAKGCNGTCTLPAAHAGPHACSHGHAF